MQEIRRQNLRRWLETHSTPAKERSYFSQLLAGKASFGEKAARRLEKDYAMGEGFLDAPTGWPSAPAQASFHVAEQVAAYEVIRRVPYFDDPVKAGPFCAPNGQHTADDANEWLPAPIFSVSARCFAVPVQGDSMDVPGGYREGDIVYIDPEAPLAPGRDVLAAITVKGESRMTLKRYKVDELGPYLLQLNGNHIIRPDTDWTVCGVVVFSGQKRS